MKMTLFRVSGENAEKVRRSNLVVAKNEKEAISLFLAIWKRDYLFNIQVEKI